VERKQPKSLGELLRENRWDFLPGFAGAVGMWLAFFAFIYAAVWIGDAARSSTLTYLIVLVGLYVLLGFAMSFEGLNTAIRFYAIAVCVVIAILWLLGLLGIHIHFGHYPD
jgi:hypothetical protein